jgi:hypothetical protein
MRWKQIALWILAAVCARCQIAAAEGPTSSPMFQQSIVNQTRFSLVGGRVVGESGNGAWMFGRPRQVLTEGPVREQINFNINGVARSFAYTYQRSGDEADQRNGPRVEFAVEMSSDGRFALRYSDKDHPVRYFNLTQVPGQPVSLSLPPSDKPHVLRAPTIWHFLIVDADDCRKQFLPMLEAIRPGWRVTLTALAAEDELVKMAAASCKSDRKQWEAWVNQLGDPLWTRRDRADRSLREVGPAVLGYLNRLNMGRLDAEQKSRLRSIIRWLSTQTGEDTPEHVASMLIEDPLVWLALLSRPDESTRQAAVQRLTDLLNVPIAINPKAEPDSQAKARDELRIQIEKIVGEGLNKPDDEPRPTGGSNKTSNSPPTR